MMDQFDYVGALVQLNEGKIIGKTRLQKTVFLLESKKLGNDFDFDYHNFGPFSSELAFAVDGAEFLGYLETEEHHGHHSIPYVIFKSTDKAPKFENDDLLEERRNVLATIRDYTPLQLEIAATAIYLKGNGYPDTSWQEVKNRKPLKAKDNTIDAAKVLVEELRL